MSATAEPTVEAHPSRTVAPAAEQIPPSSKNLKGLTPPSETTLGSPSVVSKNESAVDGGGSGSGGSSGSEGEQEPRQRGAPQPSSSSMIGGVTATKAVPPPPSTSSSSATSGSKRPLMTRTRDGRQLSEKKLRRLEKNRLSARECRRRKREAAQNLEREINILEGENLKLRLQLQIGEEAEESSRQEEERLTEALTALLKSKASEGEVFTTIEEFKEKFADYGRDRRSAIEFHLRNVERLLMPTTTTSVAMRALHGGSATMGSNFSAALDSTLDGGKMAASDATRTQGGSTAVQKDATNPTTAFADGSLSPLNQAVIGQPPASTVSPSSTESATVSLSSLESSESSEAVAPSAPPDAPKQTPLEPKKLFQYLVNYLEVSPEQAVALKDSRKVAKELDSTLAESLSMLQELKERLTQCGEDLEAEFNSVRAILTPTQAAKFLVWVANNSACMHMLNELWSRVYPKPKELGDLEDGDDSNQFPGR